MNHYSLKQYIGKQIGVRVIFCIVILIFSVFMVTLYDFQIQKKEVETRVEKECRILSEYIISQYLIDNAQAAKVKIISFNKRHNIYINWVNIENYNLPSGLNRNGFFGWKYYFPIKEINANLGYLEVKGSYLNDALLLWKLFIVFLCNLSFCAAILILLYPLAYKIPHQLFIQPINRFIDLVSNNSMDNAIVENTLPAELQILEIKILALLETAKEHERNKANIELGYLFARFAHDIRSPLTAMEMEVSQLIKKVSKNELTVLINGIKSVNDIANNILKKYHSPSHDLFLNNLASIQSIKDDGNVERPILLSNLIEIVISLKRHEWEPQPCELKLIISPEAKLKWINVSPNEVKRILSNLLNNAYDALIEKERGKIHLMMHVVENTLKLQISDNGIGIAFDKVNDVLNGVSLKHSGKGLGLSTAKQYMQSLQGKLEINTTINEGTIISLSFPFVNNLPWFPDKIMLQNAQAIVVLDDDVAMLSYWQNRVSKMDIPLKLFCIYDKASQWVEENKNILNSVVFLADYKLADNSISGLTFLKNISNSSNRYLITSHAEEYDLQSDAVKAGIYLIPKSIVNELNLAI